MKASAVFSRDNKQHVILKITKQKTFLKIRFKYLYFRKLQFCCLHLKIIHNWVQSILITIYKKLKPWFTFIYKVVVFGMWFVVQHFMKVFQFQTSINNKHCQGPHYSIMIWLVAFLSCIGKFEMQWCCVFLILKHCHLVLIFLCSTKGWFVVNHHLLMRWTIAGWLEARMLLPKPGNGR